MLLYVDGVAVPVIIYNNSYGADNFIELNGQSLMWKGEIVCSNVTTCLGLFITHSGGYVPRSAPSPKVRGDSTFEISIVFIATALGILSTIYFFVFNICHRNNP